MLSSILNNDETLAFSLWITFVIVLFTTVLGTEF